MSDFKREERYIVIKIKHIEEAEAMEAIKDVLESWQVPTVQAVVVESHTPEY